MIVHTHVKPVLCLDTGNVSLTKEALTLNKSFWSHALNHPGATQCKVMGQGHKRLFRMMTTVILFQVYNINVVAYGIRLNALTKNNNKVRSNYHFPNENVFKQTGDSTLMLDATLQHLPFYFNVP